MRAVFACVPAWLLEQRRDIGIDHLDEMWNGELHLVAMPEPIADHVTTELACALTAIVGGPRGRHLVRTRVRLGDAHDYRVPDIALVRPEHLVRDGLASAAIVVEMLGEHEEARAKLPFYAARGVAEIWLVDPATREVEIHRAIDGATVRVPDARSPVLGIDLATVAGRLRLIDGDTIMDV